MSAIRSTLQKVVFQPDGERLIAVANLRESSKNKRKETYACLVVTLEQPISVRIHFVRSYDVSGAARDDATMKKKQQFALRDVRIVDGINPRKAVPDFNLTISGKDYQLTASSVEDKELFIRQLYRLAKNYLPIQQPDFINLSLPVDVLVPQHPPGVNGVDSGTSGGGTEGADHDNTDYQPIGAKEEADFRALLSKFNLRVGEAKWFAASLNDQLMQLDGANIDSIMGSEQQITALIAQIDSALGEADTIERQLDEYDTLLSFVRDSVELIEEKASLGHIERSNAKRLMQELADFAYLMDTLNDSHIQVLRSADLSDPKSINLCCQAARALNIFLSRSGKTRLNEMEAYRGKVEALNTVTVNFVQQLFSHLTAIFANMERSMLDAQPAGEIIMQKQSQRHHALLPFSDLISWLKVAKPSAYNNTMERYRVEVATIYKREFERFFTELGHRAGLLAGRAPTGPVTESTFKSYADLLDTAIAESHTLVESEQKFCTRFFHINAADLMANLESSPAATTSSPASSAAAASNSGGSEGNVGVVIGGKSLEKHVNEHLKALLGPVFDSLPVHVHKFVAQCQQHHPYVTISMFVVLTRRLSVYQDAASYFSVLYGSMLIAVKRLFDDQMKALEHGFSQVKLGKRARVGLLDTIERFKALAATSDAIFANTERRVDLDKWHEKLVDAVVAGINIAAESPNSKYPAAVVRLENFHHLYSALSELRLDCLDSRRKNAKRLYQENLHAYVRDHMGRPLERIHIFFELVERYIENGAKPEEVGYEQQYSRMELKKVISLYPPKEVKRGLESLYKKVEKHLCPQSPLLQVVWRDMQDEFLKQLKHYQQLIGRCYPGSRIELEVSIQDVLQLFSEIAQQH